MGFNFTPTENKGVKAPFFEDARSDFAPYYGVQGWSVAKSKAAITAENVKMIIMAVGATSWGDKE